jgi:uncharacterized protein YjiS (DUF1127 family)
MTDNNDELDKLLRDQRMLNAEQRAEMIRRVIERARAYRTEAIKGLFRRFIDWTRRRTAIARLRALDDRTLKDIGLYRSDIETAVRGSEQPPERRKAA